MERKHTQVAVLAAGLLLALFTVLCMAGGAPSQALQGSDVAAAPIDSVVDEIMPQPDTALATVLELSIPDFSLQKWYSGSNQDGSRGMKILDLWDYTTYDEDLAAVTYTAGPDSTGYLDFEIINGHFLSITVTTHIKTTADVSVQASDGTLADDATFTVTIGPAPYIDFYDVYGGYPLDDPLKVPVGQNLEPPMDLDYYSGNKYGDSISDQVFTLVNSPPADLGISIYTDQNAGPFDCEHCLNINPNSNAVGLHEVEVQIENSYGLTATGTFRVLVVSRVFLPTVMRGH